MDTVEIVKLIKTTLLRRGNGTPENPIRVITQYWDFDGEIILEQDPFNEQTGNFESHRCSNIKL